MNKNDRRYIKTEKAIKQVFIQLIDEKGFEKVTIKDITDRADLNRATFYLHYKDKYDLLSSCQEGVLKDLRKLSAEIKQADIQELFHTRKPLPFLIKVFDYYQNNRQLMMILLNGGNSDFLHKMKALMIENIFNLPIARKYMNQLIVPKHYIIAYISSAHLGVLREWLDQGTPETAEEMARIVTNMTLQGAVIGTGMSMEARTNGKTFPGNPF